MIQCSKCKVQYIGETKRHLSDRFGEHRCAIEKALNQRHIDQPTAVSDHFTLPGHSINNIELIPLELINANRDGIRKAREAFLISKGKTLEPYGMNRRDAGNLICLLYTFQLSLSINQSHLNFLFVSSLNIVTVYFQFLLSFLHP